MIRVKWKLNIKILSCKVLTLALWDTCPLSLDSFATFLWYFLLNYSCIEVLTKQKSSLKSLKPKMILYDENSSSESKTVNGLLGEYSEPFEGNYGDNVHDFIEKVEKAFNYDRVPAFNKVTVLKKLVKGGRAEWSVYDWESLDDNVERLKDFFGDPEKKRQCSAKVTR